jgi:UDP-N-acetylmuramoyl-L-alanyl-D-glutamate--2,6-diaminopimelate ligase
LTGASLEVDGTPAAVGLGGLYNAYNAAAAITTADVLGIARSSSLSALTSFRPRFGRQERMLVDGVEALIVLAKNPAGANAILAELGPGDFGAIVVALNDLAADGRDVSWIYDVDYELLRGVGAPTIAAGRRARDIAIRLRYAGATPLGAYRDPARAVRAAVALGHGGVLVLATYTAMLELRRSFTGGRGASVADVRA